MIKHPSTVAPSRPRRWDLWVQTDTGKLLTYYGTTSGWQPPSAQPWGIVVSEGQTGYGAFGIGGSGVATAANTITQVAITPSITLLANRR